MIMSCENDVHDGGLGDRLSGSRRSSPRIDLPSVARVPPRCVAAFVVAVSLLAGCAVELQNAQPAQEVARATQPAGSVYTGWRVFQDRCASCHGSDAAGERAPNLLPRVREMSSRRFVDLVLYRYQWTLPAGPVGEAAAREALIDAIIERQAGALAMPAWQGEPQVNAHIADLYAYLSARAEGAQGPGRPAR